MKKNKASEKGKGAGTAAAPLTAYGGGCVAESATQRQSGSPGVRPQSSPCRGAHSPGGGGGLPVPRSHAFLLFSALGFADFFTFLPPGDAAPFLVAFLVLPLSFFAAAPLAPFL